jgi:hypothetical protein
MLKAHDVVSPTGSVVITGATLKVIGLKTIVTPYFRLAFAHLFLCAAAILALPSALTLGATPRLSGAV